MVWECLGWRVLRFERVLVFEVKGRLRFLADGTLRGVLIDQGTFKLRRYTLDPRGTLVVMIHGES